MSNVSKLRDFLYILVTMFLRTLTWNAEVPGKGKRAGHINDFSKTSLLCRGFSIGL